MTGSCKLKLNQRAVCSMLVNCNLSAWALVAVNLNIVERKKLLIEAVFVFFMLEKKNSLELGSSWAILFGCRSYFLFGMVCIRNVCPGRGEQFYLLKEWISPRLSWHVPHLLPCWIAGQPQAAPRCFHSKVYYPAMSIFRWVVWHSFPCQATKPFHSSFGDHFATQLCDSASRKPVPRKADAKVRPCRAVVQVHSLLPGSSCCALDYRLLCLHSYLTWC